MMAGMGARAKWSLLAAAAVCSGCAANLPTGAGPSLDEKLREAVIEAEERADVRDTPFLLRVAMNGEKTPRSAVSAGSVLGDISGKEGFLVHTTSFALSLSPGKRPGFLQTLASAVLVREGMGLSSSSDSPRMRWYPDIGDHGMVFVTPPIKSSYATYEEFLGDYGRWVGFFVDHDLVASCAGD